MELLQLQYFLLLANQQHFTRTAEMLHISQPALSLTIKKLEAELGVSLFDRKGRGIVLSSYGEAFKQYAEDAILALDNGKRMIARMKKEDSNMLNLGLLSPYIWNELFMLFNDIHPQVKINRRSIEDHRFWDSILDGEIDFYLGGLNQMDRLDTSRLQYVTLYEDDNETNDYQNGICASTQMYLNWNGDQSIVIKAAEGNVELLPEVRTWCVELSGGTESGVICKVDGTVVDVPWDYDADTASLLVTIPDVKVTSEIEITFEKEVKLIRNNVEKLTYDFLNQAEIKFAEKSDIIEVVRSGKSGLLIINELQSIGLDEELVKCLTEILAAQG